MLESSSSAGFRLVWGFTLFAKAGLRMKGPMATQTLRGLANSRS
jgi:hypothetical protein